MKKLTKAEEQIMHHIWDMEEVTVSQIIDQLPKKTVPHSSISSIVRILEKKGFVAHKAYGRSYVYYAIIKKEDYGKNNLLAFVGDYFEGSMNNLVSFLVNEKQIDKKELEDLLKQLENKK